MNTFSMSDLGLLSYYLGIQVTQKEGMISLCQSAYTLKILEQTGMKGCNSCHVPMENRLKLSKNERTPSVDKTKYRSVIGSLRYLVNTRPDITFSVGIVSRFMEYPKASHWAAVKQILRYLSGTVNYGCIYKIVGIVPHCVMRVCDSMVYKVEGVTPIRLAFWGSVGPRDLKPAAIRAGACVAAR